MSSRPRTLERDPLFVRFQQERAHASLRSADRCPLFSSLLASAFALAVPLAALAFLGLTHAFGAGRTQTYRDGRPHAPAILTFNRDIAPVVFEHCAVCHHEGQVASFPLLS